MIHLILAIVLLLLAVGALLWLKKPAAPPAAPVRPAGAAGPLSRAAPVSDEAPTERPQPVAPRPVAAAVPVPARPMPAELADFMLLRHEQLAPVATETLLHRLRQIPRPPTSLHKLLSPAFLETASSVALSELIMAEAQIAAKVLATVNSPLYGLKRPVASVGQAVTFLGLNTVRAICLRYMLDDSFKSSSPARRERFDTLLRVSSLSSELCTRLAQKLELPEQGALVTQGVLSFLGPLAMTSLLPTDGPAWGPHDSLLARTRDEQAAVGLGAAEVGALLMREWGLPDSIIDEVRRIEALLVDPDLLLDPRRGNRLALCYLCARLAERLVAGTLTDLAHFDASADTSADFHHLQGYLASPALARLGEALQAPALAQALAPLLAQRPARQAAPLGA